MAVPSPNLSGLPGLLAYQALWFACVLGAAAQSPPGAVLLSALALAVCLALHPGARIRRALPIAAAGYVSDAGLVGLGLLHFAGNALTPPLWLAALWLGFSVSFPALFGWLRGRPVLTAVLGGVGGTVSYLGALRLGAAATPDALALGCVLVPVWSARLLVLRWWWLRPLPALRPPGALTPTRRTA